MYPLYQKNKLLINILIAVLIMALIAGAILIKRKKPEDPSVANDRRILAEQEVKTNTQAQSGTQKEKQGDLGDANSSDPVSRGKALSGGKCEGTGSKMLSYSPMRPEQMSVVIPYGLMAGGHVTPIDHQYYWGKVQNGDADMYDVLAPADGTLIQLQYRDKSNQGQKIKGDYRGVIMYSCTFFSYFDLATSLSPEIQSHLEKGWESKGNINVDIKVQAGQVIGKVGGQSLDFAVWDTTKVLNGLLVPVAYNNAEPWKINTVGPLAYYTDEVKEKILPLYANQTLKNEGIIGQDIDGKASGNWFLEGTNGYVKVFNFGTNGGGGEYHTGHLSFAHDHVDPLNWVFSKGDVQGQPQQFGIKPSSITPDKLDENAGVVKYELLQWDHIDDKGKQWLGAKPATNIKMVTTGQAKGTVLVQLLEKRKLKVEVFMGKTPTQVGGFTASAQLFDRGDNAKMVTSNTAIQ